MNIQLNETTEIEIANNLFDSIKPGVDKTGAISNKLSLTEISIKDAYKK